MSNNHMSPHVQLYTVCMKDVGKKGLFWSQLTFRENFIWNLGRCGVGWVGVWGIGVSGGGGVGEISKIFPEISVMLRRGPSVKKMYKIVRVCILSHDNWKSENLKMFCHDLHATNPTLMIILDSPVEYPENVNCDQKFLFYPHPSNTPVYFYCLNLNTISTIVYTT